MPPPKSGMQQHSSSISSLGPIEHAIPKLRPLLGLAAVVFPTAESTDEAACGTRLAPLHLLELWGKLTLHGGTVPKQSAQEDVALFARQCALGICLLDNF